MYLLRERMNTKRLLPILRVINNSYNIMTCLTIINFQFESGEVEANLELFNKSLLKTTDEKKLLSRQFKEDFLSSFEPFLKLKTDEFIS